ncbi:glycoside hydrolase family 20 zincin-like fold domain-containing protein [Echinicola salinicaeni]|uniref:glycoside hydrolase family 20 zincin-like fold domain-containing protein n=1 Tax=Echinicola salinicaeni TaxID=2762757 RepID=UPI001C96EE87|nr:glycoside hydrolase family 20 zincin-like fold domain-containing protein [Echinicola salinicaeni]
MFVRTNVCRKLSRLNYILGCLVLLVTSNEIYGQESSDAFQARYEAKELMDAPVKLIPYPREVNWSGGNMNFQSISVKNPSSVSRLIEKELYEIFNSHRVEVNPEANYSLEFLQETSLADEAYKLSVTSRKITVVSATETGQYYALKTLKQLISLKGIQPFCPFVRSVMRLLIR